MAGVWSSDQTEILIELYQGEPTLYTVSDPNYHNKFGRMAALERIVEGLKISRPNTQVNEVKAKINCLRARFNLELGKIRQPPSGSGIDTTKIYFAHFSKLLFLQDHVAARKSFCNLPEKESWIERLELEEETEEGPNSEKEDESDNTIVGSSPSTSRSAAGSAAPSPATSEGPARKRKRLDKSDSQEDFLQKASSALHILTRESHSNEWKEFGNFVAASICQIANDRDKINCKHDILKIIMHYESKQLNIDST